MNNLVCCYSLSLCVYGGGGGGGRVENERSLMFKFGLFRVGIIMEVSVDPEVH